MRGILVLLMLVLFTAGANAQSPLAVSAQEMRLHVLRRSPVEYPATAKAEHVSGEVVLLVQVSATGKVTQVQPLSGPTPLRQAAQKSVEQWVFQPFSKGGSAIAAAGLVRVIFTLDAKLTPVEKFLSKVRANYASEPGLAQEGFSCEVEPAWREFPQVQHVPSDSPFLKHLERTRVRLLVPTADAPLTEVDKPKDPKLNLSQLAEADQLVEAARQMVEGFYATWLPFGIMGPGAAQDATMRSTPSGTVIEFRQNGMTDWMRFNAASRMVHFTELMPNGEVVEESPHFVASRDGLLYSGTDFEMHEGDATTHGAYRIEYQQVGNYRMPRTVEIEVQGKLDVHFRFTDCQVGK